MTVTSGRLSGAGGLRGSESRQVQGSMRRGLAWEDQRGLHAWDRLPGQEEERDPESGASARVCLDQPNTGLYEKGWY